jgi:hypothetical protein
LARSLCDRVNYNLLGEWIHSKNYSVKDTKQLAAR